MAYQSRLCDTCDKDYIPSSRHKSCPKCRTTKRFVPCPVCSKPKQYQSHLCKNCYSQKTDSNGNWKGGVHKHSKGYIMVKQPNHPKNNGYQFEHILVMESQLGRKLLSGENVHHLNGIRDDNRIENLELWTKPQPTGIRAKDAVEWAREIIKRYESLT